MEAEEEEEEEGLLSLMGEPVEDVTSSRYRFGGALILLGRSSLVSGREPSEGSTAESSSSTSFPLDDPTSRTLTSCSSSSSSPSRDCFLEAMFPVG